MTSLSTGNQPLSLVAAATPASISGSSSNNSNSSNNGLTTFSPGQQQEDRERLQRREYQQVQHGSTLRRPLPAIGSSSEHEMVQLSQSQLQQPLLRSRAPFQHQVSVLVDEPRVVGSSQAQVFCTARKQPSSNCSVGSVDNTSNPLNDGNQSDDTEETLSTSSKDPLPDSDGEPDFFRSTEALSLHQSYHDQSHQCKQMPTRKISISSTLATSDDVPRQLQRKPQYHPSSQYSLQNNPHGSKYHDYHQFGCKINAKLSAPTPTSGANPHYDQRYAYATTVSSCRVNNVYGGHGVSSTSTNAGQPCYANQQNNCSLPLQHSRKQKSPAVQISPQSFRGRNSRESSFGTGSTAAVPPTDDEEAAAALLLYCHNSMQQQTSQQQHHMQHKQSTTQLERSIAASNNCGLQNQKPLKSVAQGFTVSSCTASGLSSASPSPASSQTSELSGLALLAGAANQPFSASVTAKRSMLSTAGSHPNDARGSCGSNLAKHSAHLSSNQYQYFSQSQQIHSQPSAVVQSRRHVGLPYQDHNYGAPPPPTPPGSPQSSFSPVRSYSGDDDRQSSYSCSPQFQQPFQQHQRSLISVPVGTQSSAGHHTYHHSFHKKHLSGSQGCNGLSQGGLAASVSTISGNSSKILPCHLSAGSSRCLAAPRLVANTLANSGDSHLSKSVNAKNTVLSTSGSLGSSLLPSNNPNLDRYQRYGQSEKYLSNVQGATHCGKNQEPRLNHQDSRGISSLHVGSEGITTLSPVGSSTFSSIRETNLSAAVSESKKVLEAASPAERVPSSTKLSQTDVNASTLDISGRNNSGIGDTTGRQLSSTAHPLVTFSTTPLREESKIGFRQKKRRRKFDLDSVDVKSFSEKGRLTPDSNGADRPNCNASSTEHELLSFSPKTHRSGAPAQNVDNSSSCGSAQLILNKNNSNSSCTLKRSGSKPSPDWEEGEASITRCVCGFNHDDEYMICCDGCGVWQHVECMGLNSAEIPDVYFCEKCKPRKVDRCRAKALQIRKKDKLSPLRAKESTDVDLPDGANAQPSAPDASPASSVAESEHRFPRDPDSSRRADEPVSFANGLARKHLNRRLMKTKHKPFAKVGLRGGRGGSALKGNRLREAKPRRAQPSSPLSPRSPTLSPGNSPRDPGLSPKISKSSKQKKFVTPVSSRDGTGSRTRKLFTQAPLTKLRSGKISSGKPEIGNNCKVSTSTHQRASSPIGSSLNNVSLTDHTSPTESKASGDVSDLQKLPWCRSIKSSKSRKVISQQQQVKEITDDEHYEETLVNQYTPEVQILALRRNTPGQESLIRRIVSMPASKPYRLSEKKPGGLVCCVDIEAGYPIAEVRGHVMIMDQFKGNKRYAQQYVFFYSPGGRPVDEAKHNPATSDDDADNDEDEALCIDARCFGSDARVVRRSCCPTAELRHVFQNGLLQLWLVAGSHGLRAHEEVTLPFELPPGPYLACACDYLSGSCPFKSLTNSSPSATSAGNTSNRPGRPPTRQLQSQASAARSPQRSLSWQHGQHASDAHPGACATQRSSGAATATSRPRKPALLDRKTGGTSMSSTCSGSSSVSPIASRRRSTSTSSTTLIPLETSVCQPLSPNGSEDNGQDSSSKELISDASLLFGHSPGDSSQGFTRQKNETSTQTKIKEEIEEEVEVDVSAGSVAFEEPSAPLTPSARLTAAKPTLTRRRRLSSVVAEPPVSLKQEAADCLEEKPDPSGCQLQDGLIGTPTCQSNEERDKAQGLGRKMTREERKLDAIMRAFEKMEQKQKRKQQAQESKHPVIGRDARDDRRRSSGGSVANEGSADEQRPASSAGSNIVGASGKKGRRKSSSGLSTPMKRGRARTTSGCSDTISRESGALNDSFAQPVKSKRILMQGWLHEKHADAKLRSSGCSLHSVTPPASEHETRSSSTSKITSNTREIKELESSISCFKKDGASSSLSLNLETQSSTGFAASSANITSGVGSAKKRWLRQAMRADGDSTPEQTDSRCSSCTLPCTTGANFGDTAHHSDDCNQLESNSHGSDYVTPLKKRRLIRESVDSPSPAHDSPHRSPNEFTADEHENIDNVCQVNDELKGDCFLAKGMEFSEIESESVQARIAISNLPTRLDDSTGTTLSSSESHYTSQRQSTLPRFFDETHVKGRLLDVETRDRGSPTSENNQSNGKSESLSEVCQLVLSETANTVHAANASRRVLSDDHATTNFSLMVSEHSNSIGEPCCETELGKDGDPAGVDKRLGQPLKRFDAVESQNSIKKDVLKVKSIKETSSFMSTPKDSEAKLTHKDSKAKKASEGSQLLTGTNSGCYDANETKLLLKKKGLPHSNEGTDLQARGGYSRVPDCREQRAKDKLTRDRTLRHRSHHSRGDHHRTRDSKEGSIVDDFVDRSNTTSKESPDIVGNITDYGGVEVLSKFCDSEFKAHQRSRGELFKGAFTQQEEDSVFAQTEGVSESPSKTGTLESLTEKPLESPQAILMSSECSAVLTSTNSDQLKEMPEEERVSLFTLSGKPDKETSESTDDEDEDCATNGDDGATTPTMDEIEEPDDRVLMTDAGSLCRNVSNSSGTSVAFKNVSQQSQADAPVRLPPSETLKPPPAVFSSSASAGIVSPASAPATPASATGDRKKRVSLTEYLKRQRSDPVDAEMSAAHTSSHNDSLRHNHLKLSPIPAELLGGFGKLNDVRAVETDVRASNTLTRPGEPSLLLSSHSRNIISSERVSPLSHHASAIKSTLPAAVTAPPMQLLSPSSSGGPSSMVPALHNHAQLFAGNSLGIETAQPSGGSSNRIVDYHAVQQYQHQQKLHKSTSATSALHDSSSSLSERREPLTQRLQREFGCLATTEASGSSATAVTNPINSACFSASPAIAMQNSMGQPGPTLYHYQRHQAAIHSRVTGIPTGASSGPSVPVGTSAVASAATAFPTATVQTPNGPQQVYYVPQTALSGATMLGTSTGHHQPHLSARSAPSFSGKALLPASFRQSSKSTGNTSGGVVSSVSANSSHQRSRTSASSNAGYKPGYY